MQEHLGEVFDAVVSSVTSFGIFAMLENSCEGLIRYQSIQSDYFEYNDKTHTAIGKRTGKEYKIGDEVEIVVAATDILSRRIDFVLSEDATFSNIQRITQHSKPIKLRKEKHKSTYTRKKKRR